MSTGAIVGTVVGAAAGLLGLGIFLNKKASAATTPPGPPGGDHGQPTGVLLPADSGKQLDGVKQGMWFVVQADPRQSEAVRSGWADVVQVNQEPGLQRDAQGNAWQLWTVSVVAAPSGKTEWVEIRDPANPQNLVRYGFTAA